MNFKNLLRTAVAAAAVAVAASASAAPFTLDFEGVGSQASINGFYNGGTDSAGNSGVNYGVQFGSNALALKESDPIANFALPPSSETVMFFLTGTAILNYSAGFDEGFSFYYSTVSFSGTVTLWSELGATGNLLGTINLAALGEGPSQGNPFSNWALAQVSLGTNNFAKSVNFGGTVNQVAFDNITFGSTNPNGGTVPEPATLALAGAALLGVAASRRRKA